MLPLMVSPAAWSNWSGTVRCEARAVARPESEAELCELLRTASERGETIRAAGSGHSHTALVATDGVVVDLEALRGIHDQDGEHREARIGAGSLLSSLGAPLRERGLAMENLGDVDVQTLAGALATGTHGTGRRLGSLAAQVAGLRLATSRGEVIDCSERENAEIFDAARVSLGALGILTQVTLRLLPAYRLHERITREDVDECLACFDERSQRHRHCEFFWLPGKDVAEVKILDPTDRAPDPLPERRFERIDHSDRVLPSARELRFVEMEYALPAEAGIDCFRELRSLMRTRHPSVLWPLEFRSVAADDIPLSPAHGRETVTLSVHQGNELPYQAFFADAEAVLRNHRGRPHWGKWHTCTARELRDLYPRWNDFARVRETLDPRGTFLNDHLRTILGTAPR
jgi:FAD/FMN-containing dehydrogenase